MKKKTALQLRWPNRIVAVSPHPSSGIEPGAEFEVQAAWTCSDEDRADQVLVSCYTGNEPSDPLVFLFAHEIKRVKNGE